MKKTINESQLKKIVAESVKRILNESKVEQYAEYIKNMPEFKKNFDYVLQPGYQYNQNDVNEIASFIDSCGPALSPDMEKKIARAIMGIVDTPVKRTYDPNELGYYERAFFNRIMKNDELKSKFMDYVADAKESDKRAKANGNGRIGGWKTGLAQSMCWWFMERPWDGRGKATDSFKAAKTAIPYIIAAIKSEQQV